MPAPALLAHPALTGLVLAATKKSSGSPVFFILIVVMLGVYLLWLRPQRRRQQAAAQSQRQADVGDEVVTSAGIYGRVVAIDGDRVSVEVAPGMTIDIARRALGQRIDPIVIDDEPPAGDEPGTGFGQPGYDGHDDLDDEPERDPDTGGTPPTPGDGNRSPGPGGSS